MLAGLGVTVPYATAFGGTADDLELCRHYNTPVELRLESCSRVIADPADMHAAFLAHANRAQTYFAAAKGDKAMADISKAISLEPDNGVGYRVRGEFHHSFGQYEEAIADLSIALEKSPEDKIALGQRADSYGKLGKHDLAIADYDAMIRLQPDDALAFHARAFEHQALKDFTRARTDFERSFELDPSLASDFPASCFEGGFPEPRRKLVNWPRCEQ
jgi:tetratricopeptide (TPR) repeat protein